MFNNQKRKKMTSEGRSRNTSNRRTVGYTYFQNRAEAPRNVPNNANARVRLRRILRSTPTFIAFVAIAVSLMYAMSLSTTPSVVVINSDDQSDTHIAKTEQEYTRLFKDILSESVLSSTKLTINTDALEQRIKEGYPEIIDAAIALPIVSRQPVIYVRLTEPVLLYKNASSSLVIDEQGRAVDSVVKSSAEAQASLLSVSDATNISAQPGDQVLPSSHISFIQTVANQAERHGFSIKKITLPSSANQLNIQFEEISYEVRMNFTGDPFIQVGSFIATHKYLNTKKTSPKQYLDVRVEERVYYK